MRNAERYKADLLRIYALIGPSGKPCRDNKCAGCGHEMMEVAEIARKSLQLPKPGKSSKGA